jgi:hypothetical protein
MEDGRWKMGKAERRMQKAEKGTNTALGIQRKDAKLELPIREHTD